MHFVIYKHTQLLSDLSTAIAIILIPRLRYGGFLGRSIFFICGGTGEYYGEFAPLNALSGPIPEGLKAWAV